MTGPIVRDLPRHLHPVRGSSIDAAIDGAARIGCDIEAILPLGVARLVPFIALGPATLALNEWRTRAYRKVLAKYAETLVEALSLAPDELFGTGVAFVMPPANLLRVRVASLEETAARAADLLRSPAGTHISRRTASAIADALTALADRSLQSVRRRAAA
jgi:hypothetical protein